MEHTKSPPFTLPRGEGYLLFTGYLQLVAGSLSVLFSGMTIGVGLLTGDASWMNPINVARSFGPADAGSFVKLIAVYMALQIAFGWIFGLLMIASGTLSIRKKGRLFVTASAIINLFNFPHGTTVAILVLHGMSRPGISLAFHND